MFRNGFPRICGRVSFLAAAIITFLCFPVQSRSQAKDAETAVRERALAYFNAWQKGDFEAASSFIHPDKRKQYIFKIPKSSSFSGYRIDKLTCNPNKTICEIAATIQRSNPMAPDNSEMLLENQWQLLPDGEWYLFLPDDYNPSWMQKFFAKTAEMPAETQDSGALSEIDSALPLPSRFQADPANPVKLHRGEKGVFKYSYRNDGTAPIRIRAVYADCSCVSAREDFPWLSQGESATLEVVVATFGQPLGSIKQLVRVAFSDLNTTLAIEVRVENLPNFTLTPEMVDFGDLKSGRAAEMTVFLANESGRPVKIVASSKTEAQLSVGMDKTEMAPGEKVRITLRMNSRAKGDISDILILRTDLQVEPLIDIPVRGRVVS
jgi:hypothetical protein